MTYHDTSMVLENFIPSEALPVRTEAGRGSGGRLVDSQLSGQDTGCWNLG